MQENCVKSKNKSVVLSLLYLYINRGEKKKSASEWALVGLHSFPLCATDQEGAIFLVAGSDDIASTHNKQPYRRTFLFPFFLLTFLFSFASLFFLFA